MLSYILALVNRGISVPEDFDGPLEILMGHLEK